MCYINSLERFWQNELPFTEEEKRMLGLQHLAIEGALTNGHVELDEVDESMVKSTALNTAAVMNGMVRFWLSMGTWLTSLNRDIVLF